MNDSQYQNQSTCNRCKVNQTEILCNDCSPYSNFCSSCDSYVHSLPSKRTHKRSSTQSQQPHPSPQHLYQQPQQAQSHQHPSSPKSFNINPQQSLYMSTAISQSDPHNTSSVSQNYINEIKKIYEIEKEELLNKNHQIEKKLHSTSSNLNERISSLSHQLEEQSTKRDMDLHLISDSHQMELQRIAAEKDNQIQYLYSKNFELEKANEELLFKLNQYADLMNQNKIEFNDQVTSINVKNTNLERDMEELKGFYEAKLGYFAKNFSSEKNKIIDSYETTIDKLTSGYNDSKQKYVSVISQREDEIKNLIVSHRNETEGLNGSIEELRQMVNSLQGDQERLIRMNSEQKSEIEIQRNTIDKLRKEMQFCQKEKRKVDKDSEKVMKDYEMMKVQNDKMHRLTHGKLKK